jgi:DNA repair exonuclease SbcCD nuclease subunit
LVGRGYDYWALGHVHAREVLSTAPYIVFPGNLQGRHVREPGEKGATLLTLDSGRLLHVEHVPLDVLRFAEVRVQATGEGLLDAIDESALALERAVSQADGRTLAVRVHLSGTQNLVARVLGSHDRAVAEVRRIAHERFGKSVYVERVVASLAAAEAPAAVSADELSALESLRIDEEMSRECQKALEALRRKLPARLVEGPDALDLTGPAALELLLDEGRALARALLEAPE